ncbi:MAG: ABC transporter ATP-binding protein [Synergistaceae bacterium]|nr:ABC transporter ATP-binding protein [Synergistota bacterium]NLM71555.1 ABC transporter ATP-binding protein [Synergistaceae bacterium]
MSGAGLSVKGLAARYGKRSVLSDVSFEFFGGSLVSLLGRNGSGKSTLFRCILGAIPFRGEIRAGGTDTRRLNPSERARLFAYIPQSHGNACAHTAFEMTLMGTTAALGFWSSPGKRENLRAMRALEEAGISHLANRRCDRLSGGERQLVLIARALAQDAPILLMDEPCSSLDYGHQIGVMACARRLADRGYLVIMSTHSPEHALSFADRAMLLIDGSIERPGTPSEVLSAGALERMYGVPFEPVVLRADAARELMLDYI